MCKHAWCTHTPERRPASAKGSENGLQACMCMVQARVLEGIAGLQRSQVVCWHVCTATLVLQVQKSKAGTGRVVGFRELGLVNAFTMEASFAGAAVGKYAKQHFNAGVMSAGLALSGGHARLSVSSGSSTTGCHAT